MGRPIPQSMTKSTRLIMKTWWSIKNHSAVSILWGQFWSRILRICVKLQLIVNINCTVGNKFIIIPAHLIFIWNHFRNSNSKTTQKTVRKSKSKVLNQIQLSLKISEKGWNRIKMTKNKTDNISDKNWTQNNLFYRQSSIIIL